MKVLIPIGPKGSGKSTAAKILAELTGARVVAFADPIKRFVHRTLEIPMDLLYGPSETREQVCTHTCSRSLFQMKRDIHLFVEEYVSFGLRETATERLTLWMKDMLALLKEGKLTARTALITLGTDWGRAIWPEIWVDAMRRRLRGLSKDVDLVVIEDGRFLNEASFDDYCIPVAILRDGVKVQEGAHVSETEAASEEMLEWCHTHGYVVDNDGTKDELRDKLRAIVEKL